MENQTPTATVEWNPTKVYVLAAICLVLGIAIGALFHGPTRPTGAASSVASGTPGNPAQMPPQMPGADVASNPVFEQVKSDPNNFELLSQAGVAAMKAGNPKMAMDYYERALHVKEDADVRTDLGNAYLRAGDADRALQEFATVLKADPKNDKALYNTGVVQLFAKNDAKGAIATWETFLKFHPDHPNKAQVLEMIERAKKAPLKSQG
jgi:cytochrome c-type biogenesis protein CcmH/NrfG